MAKEIVYKGKKYRMTKQPDLTGNPACSAYVGGWEFEYNGTWHAVVNLNIRKQLCIMEGYLTLPNGKS